MSLSLVTLDKDIGKLPPLPATMLDVLQTLAREDVDFGQVEKKLAIDPALATRVLAVANSPFYGFSEQVTSLKDACLVLGLHATRNIVLTAGIIGNFNTDRACNLDLAGLWQHALGTASAARVLARPASLPADDAFTAGLLHDIGKMILEVYFPKDYEGVLNYRAREDCLLYEAERAVLGFDHALVGSKAAARWRLPATIVGAIGDHHQPDLKTASGLAGLVHVADIVCRGLAIGDGGDHLIPRLHPQALVRSGLDLAVLGQSLAAIEEQYEASVQLAAG